MAVKATKHPGMTMTAPATSSSTIGGKFTAPVAVTPLASDHDVAGAVIVIPGCLVALTAITTAISVVASMTWEEIDE